MGGSNALANNFLTLGIVADVVTLTCDFGQKITLASTVNVTDGQWHNVTITVETGGFILAIDDIHQVAENNVTNSITLFDLVQFTEDVYVAGVDPGYITQHPDMFDAESNFKGCLEEVRIGNLLLPFFNETELANNTSSELFFATVLDSIATECRGDPVCNTSLCENNSTCVDIWNAYECDCNPGYEGRFCEVDIDECIGNLCENNATCIDGIANYTCSCMAGYTGYM